MVLHQTLHGYRQGHNLLSSSINLPSADEDLMTIRSDWNEYVAPIGEDSSYITTYILPKSHFYVVAKTWYASEMSRPGCVWTHSFVVNLDNLTSEFDFRLLLSLFKRPNKNEKYDYNTPIDFSSVVCDDKFISLDSFSLEAIIYLYSNLIDRKELRFSAENTVKEYQSLVLTLLQYLPIEYVRGLSLCSGNAYNSNDSNSIVNLAFPSATKRSLQQIAERYKLSITTVPLGLFYIGTAIKKNESKVSNILRNFSSDIGEDRSKLIAVGELLYRLEHPESTPYSQILREISNVFPKGSGKNVKKSFLSPQIISLFSSYEDFLLDICTFEYNDAFDFESIVSSIEIYNKLNSSLETIRGFLRRVFASENISTFGHKFLTEEANKMSIEWQKELYNQDWQIYKSLLRYNPKWLYNPYWLQEPKQKFEVVLNVFETLDMSKFEYWAAFLKLILTNDIHVNTNIKEALLKYFPKSVSECLLFIQSDHQPNEICYSLCKEAPLSIIEWVETSKFFKDKTVCFISDVLNPSSYEVKKSSSYHWYKMITNIQHIDSTKLYLYFFIISMNWADNYALQILKITFYKIYGLMEKDLINRDYLDSLSPYMEELPPWQWWDNYKKFRKGLIKVMKRLGYDRKDVKDFTPDSKLNKLLIKLWDK